MHNKHSHLIHANSGSVDDFMSRQKEYDLRKRKNLKKLTKEVRREEIGGSARNNQGF